MTKYTIRYHLKKKIPTVFGMIQKNLLRIIYLMEKPSTGLSENWLNMFN